MNGVVSPLRMPQLPVTTSSMAHQYRPQQQQHQQQPSAYPTTSSRSRHQRHASNPQILLAASRIHNQQPSQQPQQQQQQARPFYHYPQPQYQQQQAQTLLPMHVPLQPQLRQSLPVATTTTTAVDTDVFAQAQAIATAQAQIQAQMQLYATATSATQQQQPQAQQQTTLHTLHQQHQQQQQPAAAGKSHKSRSRTSSASTSAAASTNRPVEWRVAIDPKTKRSYYYHLITRETTWKKPQALVELEAQEKKQFFRAMEHNIRSKLSTGTWFKTRNSNNNNSDEYDDDDSDRPPQPFRHSDVGMSSRSSMTQRAASASAERVRNSLSSMDIRSGNSRQRQQQPVRPTKASRSTPTTPECRLSLSKPAAAAADAVSNQGSTDDDDELDELDAAADAALVVAASKPPLLFRTLSSYETPVVCDKKSSTDHHQLPSPIQERVRLAGTMQQPRASDLESYTQSIAVTPSAVVSAHPQRQPLRRRSNSTSTIYVRMGTMHAPDQDATIQCVATVLRAHMVEAAAAPIAIDAAFDVFINRSDREQFAAAAAHSVHFQPAPTPTPTATLSSVPLLQDIGAFIKHVFARAQMESECIVMSLVYVERLLKATSGSLQLCGANWRSILFCSMVMASKVWDDLSMCNADFSKIWPELTLREINDLELTYLSAVEYNVRVSAVSYAKYYFHLRSMCATMGMLAAFDGSAPLNLDGARKMQVLSEEYQERAKLLPAPRRRSVTITATSSATRGGAANSATSKATKASPGASLEELVHMQVRGAGGRALSSMHRSSTKH